MDNKYVFKFVSLLKKKIFFKKIYEIIFEIRNQNIYNKLKTKADFETFHKYVTDNRTIISHQRMFRYFKHYSNDYIFDELKSKDFVMTLHILFFGDHSDEDSDIYKSSKEVLDHFYLCGKFDKKFVYKFIALLHKYQMHYKEWKEQDRIETLTGLCTNYWEYEFALELEKEHHSEEEVTRLVQIKKAKQLAVLKIIKKIEGGDEFFANYIPVFVDEKMNNLVKHNLRKAYFNMVKEELCRDEPETISLKSFLEEIKNKIAAILPNRPDIKEEMDEFLDADFLISQPKEIVTSCLETHLYETLVMMDSAEKEEVNRAAFKDTTDLLRDSETKTAFIHTMVDSFAMCLDILEDIEKKLLEFVNSELYKNLQEIVKK